MTRNKTFISLLFAAVIASGAAQAHHNDPPGDVNRCDSYYRYGYGDTDTHNDFGSQGDANVIRPGYPGDPGVGAESGHYVVWTDYGYVEVAGGNDYRRHVGNPQGARGGYVQGEVDPGLGSAYDVDFHGSAFAGSDPGPYLGYYERNACVNAANTRVVDLMQCKKAPAPGGACN